MLGVGKALAFLGAGGCVASTQGCHIALPSATYKDELPRGLHCTHTSFLINFKKVGIGHLLEEENKLQLPCRQLMLKVTGADALPNC